MAKTIEDYKKDYAAARARGDAAGMQAANDGANAIRRSQGKAEERADVDIAKFKTSGGSSGTTGTGMSSKDILNMGKGPLSSAGVSKELGSPGKIWSSSPVSGPSKGSSWGLSGGGSSGRGSSGGGSSWGLSSGGSSGSPYREYTGGDAGLDAAIAPHSEKYAEGRRLAEAGDPRGVQMMIDANNAANQERNKRGYAAQNANEDIAKMQAKVYGSQKSQAGSAGGWSAPPETLSYQGMSAELSQMLQQQLQQQQADYSEYIKQLQEAAKAKSLAELEAAYQKNMNAIDAAKGQIAPQYTDARNQVAGQAAVSRKNWQEQAAAMGLNSGAAGQSEIAMNLARQGALADLDRAESTDLAALDLQRTQATTDYNSAIAQAEASGDYELAAALYQEKVRADEARRADQVTRFQQMLQALQFEHGVSQDALAQQNWELNRKDSLEQQSWNNKFMEEENQQSQQAVNFNNLLALVSSYAESTGDYSLFGQFGFTPDQIGAWNSAWASQHAMDLQQASPKLVKDNTNPPKKIDPEPTMSLSTAKELAKSGYFNDTVLDTLRKNGYDDAAIKVIYGWDGGTPQAGTTKVDEVSVSQLGLGPVTPEYLEKLVQSGQVEEYMENGYLKFRWKQGQGGITGRSPTDVLMGRF